MTTQDLVNYYANLLILQYIGYSKNYAAVQTLATPAILPQTSVQTITFESVAASGTFVLNYGALSTSPINWNDSAATIQTALRALSGISQVAVSGSIASQLLTVTFTGVAPVATLLTVSSSWLQDSSSKPVITVVNEIDVTLPIAVQNGFNLLSGTELGGIAQGAQLDILGKYAGVTRSGNTFAGPVTLNDQDFYTLIRFAIARNNSQSSLSAIQQLLHFFFPGQMLVFDYQNMHMSYLISSALGSVDMLEVAISEGLLPKPMAVGIGLIIFAPIIDAFFGFQTYALWPVPVANNSPFNDYASYQTDWPWLTYSDAIFI